MVKEEVKEMAVEEPKEEVEETTTEMNEVEEELSPWYYFFSVGCGWCKKTTPIVEELLDEGHDVLMLDLAEPNNQQLAQELKEEYKTQCGTPWFINADTGKGICGFREKDVLKKWLDGEDIPEPPRPTGPPPKPPFHGSTNKENIAWKKTYTKWVKDNKHMPDDWQKQQKSASEIIDSPRPKSDPPRPPMGPQMAQATDADFDKWGEEMKAWQEENKHLPNLQPVDNIVQNLKNRKNQLVSKQGNPELSGSPTPSQLSAVVSQAEVNTFDAKVQALEVKIDKIMNHFGVK